MQELKPIKEGKVREIYDNGDSLIMVATDRISCFDVILNNEVFLQVRVLCQGNIFRDGQYSAQKRYFHHDHQSRLWLTGCK